MCIRDRCDVKKNHAAGFYRLYRHPESGCDPGSGVRGCLLYTSETNTINMMAAADKVSTGLITYAARDSEYDGKRIRKGEIMLTVSCAAVRIFYWRRLI